MDADIEPREPEAPEGDAPEGQLEAATASDDGYIRISRNGLHAELGRLIDQDPDFRQAARTIVGSRLRPVEREARAERLRREEAEAELAAQRYRAWEQEGVLADRLVSDPAEARRYADVVAKLKPEAREIAFYERAIEDDLDDLVAAGIPESRKADYKKAIADGYFGVGIPAREIAHNVARAAARERAEFEARLRAPAAPAARPAQPQPAQDEAPRANPRLAGTAPETTGVAASAGGGKPRYRTLREASVLFNDGRIDAAEYVRAKNAGLPYD